jgi:hypothetical protein
MSFEVPKKIWMSIASPDGFFLLALVGSGKCRSVIRHQKLLPTKSRLMDSRSRQDSSGQIDY